MKRILLILILTVLCVLVGCADEMQSDTNPTKQEQPSNDLESDGRLLSTDRVFTSYTSEDGSYYCELKEYKVKEYFTQEVLSFWQFKMFSSCEEFNEFFYAPDIDPEIFEDNYIVYFEGSRMYYSEDIEEIGLTYKHIVGYHSFEEKDGVYSMVADMIHYQYEDSGGGNEVLVNTKQCAVLLIPKNEIEYVEGIQRVNLSAKNVVENEIHLRYLQDKEKLLQNPCLLLIDKNKAKDNEYNINLFKDWTDENGKVAVLYYEWSKGRLAIVDHKIENGNLYITANSYSKNPPIENEVYQLCGVDVSELSENYTVYVTINEVTVSEIPILRYEYDEADALCKAKILFSKAHKGEMTEGYVYDFELTEGYDSSFWSVSVYKKQEIDGVFQPVGEGYYIYVIGKATLEVCGSGWAEY